MKITCIWFWIRQKKNVRRRKTNCRFNTTNDYSFQLIFGFQKFMHIYCIPCRTPLYIITQTDKKLENITFFASIWYAVGLNLALSLLPKWLVIYHLFLSFVVKWWLRCFLFSIFSKFSHDWMTVSIQLDFLLYVRQSFESLVRHLENVS